MSTGLISAGLAAAILASPTMLPPKSPRWTSPQTIYVDLPHNVAFAVSNGWDRAYSTRKPLRRGSGQHTRDSLGSVLSPCSTASTRCFEGLVTLAVNQAALDQEKPYEAAGVAFMPTCLYRRIAKHCGLAVIRHVGKAGSQNEGAAGFFVYEAGFGVRVFAGADSQTGEISGVFSYASGRPLLAK
jgi:hypothetical protein